MVGLLAVEWVAGLTLATVNVRLSANNLTKGTIMALGAFGIDSQQCLLQQYRQVRQYTETLAAPLSEADAQLQSMPDVSPAKWHLAHTSWFFETFILSAFYPHYQVFDPAFNYLFNSYYNGIGEQYPRHQRGLISRPSLSEVLDYRHYIDRHIERYLADTLMEECRPQLLTLGLHHEQQHQELLLTDIQHCLFNNPQYPVYQPPPATPCEREAGPLEWLPVAGGVCAVGCGGEDFSFDNERPRHSVYLEDFTIASRLITNAEYTEFIADGGYLNPDYWLADGWDWLQRQRSSAPLYWLERRDQWYHYSLYGLRPLAMQAPVAHVNYFFVLARRSEAS